MQRYIALVSVLVTLIYSHIALAKTVSVVGMGANPCSEFLSATSMHLAREGRYVEGEILYSKTAAYAQWLSGFSSAFQDILDKPVYASEDKLTAEAVAYCTANPEATLDDAASFVMMKLSKAQKAK